MIFSTALNSICYHKYFCDSLIILLFLFLSLNVSCSNQDNTREIFLEEPGDSLLIGVSNIDVNTDCTRLLIADRKSGNVSIFDLNDGNLIKYYKPDWSYTDSITSLYHSGRAKLYEQNYIRLDSLIRKRFGSNEFDKKLKENKETIIHTFLDAQFVSNNEIVVFGSFKSSFLVEQGYKYLWGSAYNIGFIKINLLTNKQKFDLLDISHIDSNKFSITPWGRNFFYNRNNNKIYSKIFIDALNEDDKIDSLEIIAEYSSDGSLVRRITPIPKEQINSELFYEFASPIFCKNSSNDFDLCFQNIPAIFTGTDRINLNDFPGDSCYPSIDIIKERKRNRLPLVNFQISSLFMLNNNNYLLQVFLLDTNNGHVTDNILLEYSTKGNLIAKKSLWSAESDIGNIHYHINTNKILYFKRNKNGDRIVTIQTY